MDAVKIMQAYGRMCDTEKLNGCEGCGLSYESNGTGKACEEFIKINPEKAVRIIKKWSSEHLKKTRRSEFLKMFPNAVPLYIAPCHIDTKMTDDKCRGKSCYECRKEYWSQEVE